jgi:hypothetical protein
MGGFLNGSVQLKKDNRNLNTDSGDTQSFKETPSSRPPFFPTIVAFELTTLIPTDFCNLTICTLKKYLSIHCIPRYSSD